MYTTYRGIFSVLVLAVASATWAGASRAVDAPATPMLARKVDVVDHDFGLTMPDPYRWMEGENNAEFDAYLKAQGTAARAKLDALPTLESWRKKLAEVAGVATIHSKHTLVGKRLFYLRAPAGKEGMLMVRETDGKERVLFDPSTIQGGANIGTYSVSPDGDKVGVALGLGGNEIGEIAIIDVTTSKRLADTPTPVWDEFAPSWLPDSSGFFYTRMRDIKPGDADPMQGMGAYLHKLGQPQSADKLLARAGVDDMLKIAANDFPWIRTMPGSNWAVLEKSGAHKFSSMCVALLTDAIARHTPWRCLINDADNVQGWSLRGDTLYLMSAMGAPNFRVLALDLRDVKASVARAKIVVPERSDAVLTQISVARDSLYLKSMHRGLDHVERMNYASGALASVTMPGDGMMNMYDTDPRLDGALLSLESWTVAPKVYRYDGNTLTDTGLGMVGAPAYPDLVAEEIDATSTDGTKVPLSVIRHRDLALDGHARVIVRGYGGYGYILSAAFKPVVLEWPKAGNLVAICHARGGGENGDAWHTDGSGPNKQRGIEDFIACAKELTKRGYSVPALTGGLSGSAGGILVGGAYTTAPEAWGAMAIQSGVLNAVRLLAAKNGANQIAEMGDPRTEAGMKQLLAMDPYQHLRDGVKYPPLLLSTGAVDQRVAPWNSGKFGARVTAASPKTLVWFRTDEALGHFATNMNALASEYADVYAFFDAQLHGQ